MIAFVWTSFSLAGFGVLMALWNLARSEYPRRTSNDAWEDVLMLLLQTGWCVWAWVVLP